MIESFPFLLLEGTSEAAKFLRANGITLLKVREETVKLLGKSDMFFFSPEHPPLTEPAQRALDLAVDEKLKSGYSESVWLILFYTSIPIMMCVLVYNIDATFFILLYYFLT